jgi:hypothetical protein
LSGSGNTKKGGVVGCALDNPAEDIEFENNPVHGRGRGYTLAGHFAGRLKQRLDDKAAIEEFGVELHTPGFAGIAAGEFIRLSAGCEGQA